MALSLVVEGKRPCGSCTKCCEGTLTANVHGQMIGQGKSCCWLSKRTGCTVYETRAPVCKDYICEWKRDLRIPEEFKPNLTNVIFTLRYLEGGKGTYVRVTDFNVKRNEKIWNWCKEQWEKGTYKHMTYSHYPDITSIQCTTTIFSLDEKISNYLQTGVL